MPFPNTIATGTSPKVIGSAGGGGGVTEHNALTGIQGGAADDHYHLTNAQVALIPSDGEKAALAGTEGTPGVGNAFVTDSDARLPDADEKAALAGTDGTPSAINPFVTSSDTRVPTTDEAAALTGTSGAPSNLNRFVTDADGRLPTADENAALAGTNGSPSDSNRFVTNSDARIPTTGENDALQGTSGTPSNTNRFVTNDDSRLTLNYQEAIKTAQQSVSTSWTDITSLSVTITVGAGKAVEIEGAGDIYIASNNYGGASIWRTDGAGNNLTNLATQGNGYLLFIAADHSATALKKIDVPGAGTWIYKIRAKADSGALLFCRTSFGGQWTMTAKEIK